MLLHAASSRASKSPASCRARATCEAIVEAAARMIAAVVPSASMLGPISIRPIWPLPIARLRGPPSAIGEPVHDTLVVFDPDEANNAAKREGETHVS